MRPLSLLLIVAIGCGDDSAATSTDAGPVEMLDTTAVPDPAERTDCMTAPPADGEALAKHVTCDEELLRGTVAMGRTGDVILANARVRFLIRGGDASATTIGAYAGGIVDAAPHGGVDLIKEILPALDISAIRPDAIVVTDAGGDGQARVRVVFTLSTVGLIAALVPGLGSGVDARGVLDYELRADEDALRISVQLTAGEASAGGSGRPTLLSLMGAAELVQPFRELLEPDGGPGGDGVPVLLAERAGTGLAIRMMSAEGSAAHAGSINLVSAGDRASLRPLRIARFEARVGVGASAAEAWNAVHAGDDGLAALTLEGAPGDRAALSTASGELVMRTTLGGDGRTVVRLAPGEYVARPGFGGFFEGADQAVTLTSAGTTLALVPAGRGTLSIEASADGDATAPVRVTIARASDEIDRRVAFGTAEWSLPPGSYTVTVSRGMEYDIHQQDVTLADGGTAAVSAVLDRLVDTTGWVAGDFHIHSELSTDSVHGILDLLGLIAGEGLEVVASSDHDHLAEYPRFVEEAGVADHVLAVTGVESSPSPLMHANGYPLVAEGTAAGNGTPVWFGMTPGAIFDALRDRGDPALGGAIVQLNHPNEAGAGFFRTVGLDLETGHATASPMDLGLPMGTDLDDFDFDVVEVLNGTVSDEDDLRAFEAMLALWSVGRRFWLVGNSDTHGPSAAPGTPRTYVRVADDSPRAFDFPEVAGSLRNGAATLSSGIFVTASQAGAPSGDSVPIAVRVQAAPWVDVDRLEIYAGRTATVERPLTDTGAAVRLDETIDVPLAGAGFVVVRVSGTDRTPPVLTETPFGITNPIPIE